MSACVWVGTLHEILTRRLIAGGGVVPAAAAVARAQAHACQRASVMSQVLVLAAHWEKAVVDQVEVGRGSWR